MSESRWIALVGPELEENLALRSLAASLARAGFSSRILPFNDGAAFQGIVESLTACEQPPFLVGLSLAFQWRGADVLALAMALRQAGYQGHLTAGGHFGTFAALDVLRDFAELDSLCLHEAEETLVELAQCLAQGRPWRQLTGLAARDGEGRPVRNATRLAPELTTLPWPDRRGAPAQCLGHCIAPLVGSRGCYANCSFCCIAAWHEAASPGKRYRHRPLEDVADELAHLHHRRGVDIFVFHDDNFFLPNGGKNLERITALGELLDERGVRDYATVVKARPTDVQPAVFSALVQQLHCIRAYVGIETDSDQGLATLSRWARSKHNWEALRVIDSLGLYVCFNLLIFDPDTTLESLEHNLRFIEAHAHHPFNFGRVELYAGTPLLERMQAERRAVGDWLQWDYPLNDQHIQRVFQMATRAFFERNFSGTALANELMTTRFEVEVARHFHPELFRPTWLEEAKRLNRTLGSDSAQGLRRLISHVRETQSPSRDEAVADELALHLRQLEAVVRERARALEEELRCAVAGQATTATPSGPVLTPNTTATAGRAAAVAIQEPTL